MRWLQNPQFEPRWFQIRIPIDGAPIRWLHLVNVWQAGSSWAR